MQVEVVKWGNSSAVRLPAAVLKEAHVALGDRLELTAEDGKIVLEPSRREYRLQNLLKEVTKENRHAPIDVGGPMGREAW